MKRLSLILFLLAFLSLACIQSAASVPGGVGESVDLAPSQTAVSAATIAINDADRSSPELVVCAAVGLNVRGVARAEGAVLRWLKPGDPITVYDVSADGGWAKIAESAEEWVSVEYLCPK